MSNIVEIKADTEAYTIYGGYGVVFGGHDLDGDTFTKETDFQIDLVPSKPLFVDHTMDTELKTRDGATVVIKGIDEPVGKVTTVTADDIGLYIEFMVEKANRYWSIVDAMYNTGKMGLSSGAVAHLVRRAGGVIKRWPVVEWSATVSPAEPRTVQVQRIKAQLDALDDAPNYGDMDADSEVITETVDAEPISEAGDTPAVDVEAEAKTVDDIQATTDTGDAGDVPAVESIKMEFTEEEVAAIMAALVKPINPPVEVAKAPAVLTTGRGDNETKALAHWYKTGDTGAVSHMLAENGRGIEIKSNATDLNITTAADGGNAVPTGHYQGIIARRNEEMLTSRLGIMPIPGQGTTVNVPVDAGTANAFVSTSETSGYDLDGPALGQVVMTLVKYTKLVKLSEELLQDEDSQLMNFLNDYVGRALAVTHNTLLLTEAANGTKFADFAATSIAAGKMESIVGNDTLDPYLAGGRVAWVMRNSTQWAVNSILGSARIYNGLENVPAREGGDLLGYPVFRSAAAAAIATGTKSVFFGNWSYMGYREAPSMTVLRDPYTLAANGQIQLVYMFRAVYKILQAGAIGYGLHA